MNIPPTGSLPKRERLCGKADIARLLDNGRYGYVSGLKYCFASGSGEDCNRMMVSVSKKFFKRAVKRNLLKRRIRENYRTRKGMLPEGAGIDVLIMYNSKEIMDFASIGASVERILLEVSGKVGEACGNE